MLTYSVKFALEDYGTKFNTPHEVLVYLVTEHVNPVIALEAELFCIDSDHGDREDFGKFSIFVSDSDYFHDND